MVLGNVLLFTLLAGVLLTYAILLIRALDKYFTPFYMKFRKALLMVTSFIAVPLAFRAFFDGLKWAVPSFSDWIDDNKFNNSLYNFFFFLLTTYLPIVSQMGTLVFGYTRIKTKKELHSDQDSMSSEI